MEAKKAYNSLFIPRIQILFLVVIGCQQSPSLFLEKAWRQSKGGCILSIDYCSQLSCLSVCVCVCLSSLSVQATALSQFLREFRDSRGVTWCLWTARAPRRTPWALFGAWCRNKRSLLVSRQGCVTNGPVRHRHTRARVSHTTHTHTHTHTFFFDLN